MAGVELFFDIVELKVASTMLKNLSRKLENKKLSFTFRESKGETVDELKKLIEKYNELGSSLAQLVGDVQKSTDMTREGIKRADTHLGNCWDGLTGELK